MRYPFSILKTISILKHERPDVLFVQNPSMILAAFACLCKYVWSYFLVVDRHTTFLLDLDYKNSFPIVIFKLMHRLTIRYADITIVTNSILADIVMGLKGSPYILPDIIPTLIETKQVKLKSKNNILMISSFGIDEPIKEVLRTMENFSQEEVCLYITGNYKKLDESILRMAPSNVIFTGFLDEQDYINMLFSSDAIMVLTTASACMLCGCYEAIAANKPLITSDKDVLREYFTDAVFVDNSVIGISVGIKTIIDNIDYYRERISILKKNLILKWEQQYNNLEKKLSNINL